MTTTNSLGLVLGMSLGLTLSACGGDPADEYRQALPNQDQFSVGYPEAGTTASGLTGEKKSALVGEPSQFFTATYYESRKINGFGKRVLRTIDRITDHAPSAMTDSSALWGPFSDSGEPNEYRLGVSRRDSPALHYVWKLQGKHKSASSDDYVSLAGGAFQPTGAERGRGWFAVNFEAIRSINPTEGSRGQIAYAYVVADAGVHVRAAHRAPSGERAGYAFGADREGNRFVLFAIPESIDLGPQGTDAKEAVLIRTRWNALGGRADVLASRGDLGSNILHASQCWDETFVSSYESMHFNGNLQAEEGDATTCVQGDAAMPAEEELPQADGELENPYEDEEEEVLAE
jgi:hypothetical protein